MPAHWKITVIIICVLIAAFTLWQEITRPNRSRLAWRIIACLLALASLACIALPVSYRSKAISGGNNEAVLLTPGFQRDSVSDRYKVVFTTDRGVKKVYPKAILISSLTEIPRYRPAIKQVSILGFGLDEAELYDPVSIPLTFHPPGIPPGVQSINWLSRLKTGEMLKVQGQYKNDADKAVILQLKGLNTLLDSIVLPAGKTSTFNLQTFPKNTGRAVYNLLALSGKDTVANESLPLQIEPVKPIRVLMLSSAPNFETRFLKNWLADNGYAVATRSVISTNKISQDFVNIEKLPLDKLNSTLLDKFDAVVGDLSALKSLSATENAALRQQVMQKSLGVVIRADSASSETSWLQRNFLLNTVTSKTDVQLPLTLRDQPQKTARINIDPTYINNRSNLQVIASGPQSQVLAATALSGAGKLVFTTLNRTYTWMLDGNTKDYSALWSLLIGQAARRATAGQALEVDSPFPAVGIPVKITLQSAIAPATFKVNGENVSPGQNATVPYEWAATYWPEQAGWQQVDAGSNRFWWYNYSKNDWTTLRNLKKMRDTKNFVAKQNPIAAAKEKSPQFVEREVPKLYFYLLLLTSCTFLWVERKLIA